MNEMNFAEIKSEDLRQAAQLLTREHYTCVLCKNGKVLTASERGVKPLLGWVDEGKSFEGFSAADQVVGKAAALLYVKLGITELYCRILSRKAKPVLERNGIAFCCATEVPCIINRAGNGMCPMEHTVLDIEDPGEAVFALKEKLADMHAKSKGNFSV